MLHKFFTNDQGKVVVIQKPNLPILVWAATTLLAHILHDRALAHSFSVASRTALFVWAVLEIGWGASYFRRLLGLVILAWSIASLFW